MPSEIDARMDGLDLRLSSLREDLNKVLAQLDPQTLRQSLERTFDPRGGEPRFVDQNGVTLAYAPAVQVTGASTTVDVKKQRVVISVTPPTPYADLQWVDGFATNQFVTAYRDVFNFTVAGGFLTWNPATGNGGWAVKTGSWYNTMQSLLINKPAGNTAQIHLLTRARTMPATPGLALRWDNATGALDIFDVAAGAVLATSAAPHVPPNGANRWMMFASQGDRFFGCVTSAAPANLNAPAQIIASVAYTLPVADERTVLMDSGVGLYVLCFGAPIMTIDDYQIWRA